MARVRTVDTQLTPRKRRGRAAAATANSAVSRTSYGAGGGSDDDDADASAKADLTLLHRPNQLSQGFFDSVLSSSTRELNKNGKRLIQDVTDVVYEGPIGPELSISQHNSQSNRRTPLTARFLQPNYDMLLRQDQEIVYSEQQMALDRKVADFLAGRFELDPTYVDQLQDLEEQRDLDMVRAKLWEDTVKASNLEQYGVEQEEVRVQYGESTKAMYDKFLQKVDANLSRFRDSTVDELTQSLNHSISRFRGRLNANVGVAAAAAAAAASQARRSPLTQSERERSGSDLDFSDAPATLRRLRASTSAGDSGDNEDDGGEAEPTNTSSNAGLEEVSQLWAAAAQVLTDESSNRDPDLLRTVLVIASAASSVVLTSPPFDAEDIAESSLLGDRNVPTQTYRYSTFPSRQYRSSRMLVPLAASEVLQDLALMRS